LTTKQTISDGYLSNNGAETNREKGTIASKPVLRTNSILKNMLHRRQKNIQFTCHDKILEPQIIINVKSERVSSENNPLIIFVVFTPNFGNPLISIFHQLSTDLPFSTKSTLSFFCSSHVIGLDQ
jgi:hypothetical protein